MITEENEDQSVTAVQAQTLVVGNWGMENGNVPFEGGIRPIKQPNKMVLQNEVKQEGLGGYTLCPYPQPPRVLCQNNTICCKKNNILEFWQIS